MQTANTIADAASKLAHAIRAAHAGIGRTGVIFGMVLPGTGCTGGPGSALSQHID